MKPWIASVAVGSAMLLAPLSFADAGGPAECNAAPVTVDGGSAKTVALVCEAAKAAIAELSTCNIPLQRTIRIEISADLPEFCMARYHCGEDWIRILPPAAMNARRLDDSIFSQVPDGLYFHSVVLHEIAHAAHDAAPCPIAACLATGEYVAYSMQIRSLPDTLQETVIRRPDLDRRISRDEINPMIALMAPDVFAQKAWLHFSQRPEPCDYMGLIMDGSILFDHERP